MIHLTKLDAKTLLLMKESISLDVYLVERNYRRP